MLTDFTLALPNASAAILPRTEMFTPRPANDCATYHQQYRERETGGFSLPGWDARGRAIRSRVTRELCLGDLSLAMYLSWTSGGAAGRDEKGGPKSAADRSLIAT